MYTLFGTKGSGSAMVEAAFTLFAAPLRLVDAASWEAGPGRDELARANPLCQIPTLLLPDGAVLSESAAILLHLGLTHRESPLLPAAAALRAQAVRGLVYIAANCYAAIGIIDFPERWCANPDAATSRRIKTGSTARLHDLWDAFADIFPAHPYLSGQELGALDLMAAVVSKWSGSRPHLSTSRPAFSALLGRIESDARVAPVFQRHWPAA